MFANPEVQAFIDTEAYRFHKRLRFSAGDDRNLTRNPAFLLHDRRTRTICERLYRDAGSLLPRTARKCDG